MTLASMLSIREKLNCTAAKVYNMQWCCFPSPLCIPMSLPRMPAVFKRMARSLNASARRFWSLHNSCSDHKTLKMSWRFNRPIGSNRHIFCHVMSQGYSKGSDIQSQKLLLHLIIQALHHCRPGCREGIGLEKNASKSLRNTIEQQWRKKGRRFYGYMNMICICKNCHMRMWSSVNLVWLTWVDPNKI